ncbi:MAG: hypothetical protein LKK00_10160 [Intestinimonas sp.]|nr:hypothetical protein [Intestinimonas sp.]
MLRLLKRRKVPKNIRRYLMEPVSSFPWYRVEPVEQTVRGRLALMELARRIQEVLDSHRAEVDPNLRHQYFYHLHEVKKAMEIGRYGLACHELEDVIHDQTGISRQVLCNILTQIHVNPEEQQSGKGKNYAECKIQETLMYTNRLLDGEKSISGQIETLEFIIRCLRWELKTEGKTNEDISADYRTHVLNILDERRQSFCKARAADENIISLLRGKESPAGREVTL